jgi:hypothetical protein
VAPVITSIIVRFRFHDYYYYYYYLLYSEDLASEAQTLDKQNMPDITPKFAIVATFLVLYKL